MALKPFQLCDWVAAFSACYITGAAAADWPQWRGPDRNGISSETVSTFPPNGPALLWRASIGTGFSSLAIGSGRVFTMGNSEGQDTIWCFDAVRGRELWRHSYASRLDPQFYEGGPTSTPVIDDTDILTINKWGTVLCQEAASGKVVWQHDLWNENIRSNRWGFAGSPLVWHDLVLLNAGGAGTALNRKTGQMVWFNGTEPAGYASPVVVNLEGKDVALIFAAKGLIALDPRTGRILWRHPFETGYDTNNSDPVVHHDTVLLSSYSHGCELLRMHLDRAELIYSSKALYNHLSPGILFGDYLYAFNGEAHHETDFRCLHLPTGQVKWSTKSPAFGSLIGLAQDKLLILSEKGELTLGLASPTGFKAISRAQVMGGVCWTPPAFANGRLYLRNAKGDLKCFELSETRSARK
jgi:outer membrane protein assembly factor BamB